MHFVIPFVSPVVFRARKSLSKQTKQWEHHITGHFLGYPFEFIYVNPLFLPETKVKDFTHFLKAADSLIEWLQTTSLLCKFTFAYHFILAHWWHTRDDRCDIGFSDVAILVKVIDCKNKELFLVKSRTIKFQQTCQKLLGTQVSICILIQNWEKSFSNKSWQLAVVTERDSIDPFVLVVTTTA